MTARINADRLRREIVARGRDMQNFARLAGISAATLSHAVNGRPVVAGTLRRITSALFARAPPRGCRPPAPRRRRSGRTAHTHGAAGVQTAPAAEGDRGVRSNPTRRTS
jgi:hypothetical protein